MSTIHIDGICDQCPEAVDGTRLCQTCTDKQRVYDRNHYLRTANPNRIPRGCTICKQKGHYAKTCKVQP